MRKYDSYKPTKIEFLDEIPEHWEEKRMRFLGYLYGGLSGKSATDFNQLTNEANKYFIPFTNIANNFRIDPESLQTVVISENENQNSVQKGDIFFLMSSENYDDVGKSAVLLVDLEETYLNSFCKGFRITKDDIVPEFLNYQLHSKQLRHNLLTGANGFTRINLKIDKVIDLLTALPPPEEQTAIAHYLDQKTAEIDELIADKKRLLELYEEEKTAIINQAVTKGINPDVLMKDSGIEWLGDIPEHWDVKRFKYYFNLITEKVEEDLPKIGLENIESKSGRFIETGSDFAGQGVRFRPKDVLFGKLRPYLAKVWLSDFDGQAVGDFYVFRSKQEVLPEFAKYRILDSSFIEVTNSSTYGSKMPRVSWEFIADLPIAFPKIQEQESIVSHIETECALIDAKRAKTEKLIELLTEYRTALISEVVTGKIKVTE